MDEKDKTHESEEKPHGSPRLLTIKEVASLLRCGEPTVRNYMKAGNCRTSD